MHIHTAGSRPSVRPDSGNLTLRAPIASDCCQAGEDVIAEGVSGR